MMKKLFLTLMVLAISVFVMASCNNNTDEPDSPSTCEHNNVVTLPEKRPTCTETGLTEGEVCADCGAVISGRQSTNPFGHRAIVTPERAATCEAAGSTESQRCATCREYILSPEVIPQLAHSYVDSADVEATCTESGRKGGRHCSVCFTPDPDSKVTVTDPTGNHTLYESAAAVLPTCSATGLTAEQSCSVCKKVIVKAEEDEINPDAHNFVDGVCTYCQQPETTDEVGAD